MDLLLIESKNFQNIIFSKIFSIFISLINLNLFPRNQNPRFLLITQKFFYTSDIIRDYSKIYLSNFIKMLHQICYDCAFLRFSLSLYQILYITAFFRCSDLWVGFFLFDNRFASRQVFVFSLFCYFIINRVLDFKLYFT